MALAEISRHLDVSERGGLPDGRGAEAVLHHGQLAKHIQGREGPRNRKRTSGCQAQRVH